MSCRASRDSFRATVWRVALAAFLLAAPAAGAAGETIFLEDGKTIQVDKVEELGDRYRVERHGATFDIPKEKVMTIHPTTPPSGTPSPTPPADVYKGITQEMNEKVRREIQAK